MKGATTLTGRSVVTAGGKGREAGSLLALDALNVAWTLLGPLLPELLPFLGSFSGHSVLGPRRGVSPQPLLGSGCRLHRRISPEWRQESMCVGGGLHLRKASWGRRLREDTASRGSLRHVPGTRNKLVCVGRGPCGQDCRPCEGAQGGWGRWALNAKGGEGRGGGAGMAGGSEVSSVTGPGDAVRLCVYPGAYVLEGGILY